MLQNKHFIIISSDSDFSKPIEQLLNNSKEVTVISRHANNKRLRMYLPLQHPNLKLVSLDNISKNTSNTNKAINSQIKSHNNEKEIFYCFVCNTRVKQHHQLILQNQTSYICDSCNDIAHEKFDTLTLNNLKLFRLDYQTAIIEHGEFDEENYIESTVIPDDEFSNGIDLRFLKKSHSKGSKKEHEAI